MWRGVVRCVAIVASNGGQHHIRSIKNREWCNNIYTYSYSSLWSQLQRRDRNFRNVTLKKVRRRMWNLLKLALLIEFSWIKYQLRRRQWTSRLPAPVTFLYITFYIVIHQVSLLPPQSHAACTSMSTTTTTTTTTRDRGDRYGPMEWAQSKETYI